MKDLLTTAELAKYLHLKATTVRRKAARGEIPAVKIGKHLRFDRAEIDNWLRERRIREAAQILVVDDEPVIGELIRDASDIAGYRATITLSSLEALEIVRHKRFHLIFIDLIMPELDGGELFKRVREIDKDVPVVIVTGYPDSEVMARAIEHGPFLVIKKPFVVDDILRVLRTSSRSTIVQER
jgi:excisionase family DNA binding protein